MMHRNAYKGGYTSAQKYFKIKSLKRKGVFVSIKKGTETKVPNGFVSASGIFMKRQGKDRYPLKRDIWTSLTANVW